MRFQSKNAILSIYSALFGEGLKEDKRLEAVKCKTLAGGRSRRAKHRK